MAHLASFIYLWIKDRLKKNQHNSKVTILWEYHDSSFNRTSLVTKTYQATNMSLRSDWAKIFFSRVLGERVVFWLDDLMWRNELRVDFYFIMSIQTCVTGWRRWCSFVCSSLTPHLSNRWTWQMWIFIRYLQTDFSFMNARFSAIQKLFVFVVNSVDLTIELTIYPLLGHLRLQGAIEAQAEYSGNRESSLSFTAGYQISL